MSLARLTPDECPLIDQGKRESLVERFNLTLELFEFAQEVVPPRYAAEVLDPVRMELDSLRYDMTRKYYSVGFLGPFQAGKSRTFNNVLCASINDQPSSVGHGFATTAVVTRLRRSRDTNRLQVRFLSTAEYQEKRDFLVRITGFDGNPSDREILAQVPEIIRDWQKNPRMAFDAAGNLVPVRRRDLEYLALMLNSYSRFKDEIHDVPRKRIIDYDQRDQYLTHPPDPWHEQTGVLTPLIQEAIIEYQTDVIPETLEMIDLPGYDGECSVDAFLTDQFLMSLQGALVFCRATDFGAVVDTIVSRLRGVLGNDLRGRVWLVITCCDDIRVFPGSTNLGQTSLFKDVKNFVERMGIPLNQVLFVTNEPKELEKRLSDASFRRALEESIESADWPGLREAWKELDNEGGIKALRDLIAKRLAREVGAAVERTAAAVVQRLYKDLLRNVRLFLEEQMLEQLPRQVAIWRNVLVHSKQRVVAPATIHAFAAQVCKQLEDIWRATNITSDLLDDRICSDGNRGLQKEFEVHTLLLERTLRRWVADRWLPQMYQQVIDWVSPREAEYGRLIMRGVCQEGVVRELQRILEEDRQRTDWMEGMLPSFCGSSPFDDLPEEAQPIYTGEQYLQVLGEKIKVVSRRLALVLALRVQKRLEELLGKITREAISREMEETIVLPEATRSRVEYFEDCLRCFDS